jgi:hypothetical protein
LRRNVEGLCPRVDYSTQKRQQVVSRSALSGGDTAWKQRGIGELRRGDEGSAQRVRSDCESRNDAEVDERVDVERLIQASETERVVAADIFGIVLDVVIDGESALIIEGRFRGANECRRDVVSRQRNSSQEHRTATEMSTT